MSTEKLIEYMINTGWHVQVGKSHDSFYKYYMFVSSTFGDKLSIYDNTIEACIHTAYEYAEEKNKENMK